MTGRDRPSSEELIRSAQQRIRGEQADAPSSDQPDEQPNEVLAPSTPSPDPVPRPRGPAPGVAGGPAAEPLDPPQVTNAGGGRFWSSLVLRLVIAGAIAGGWWLFTSFDDADRADSGEIVGGGDLSVMTLQPGDCFDDPDGEVVYDVQAIPCSEPHDNEVFAIGEFGSSASDVFPGLTALDDFAYEQCTSSRFESYVGVEYLDSELGVFTLTPTEESWGEGDRGYICALYRLDLAKLTGTARASEL